jgi:hypothetical protein
MDLTALYLALPTTAHAALRLIYAIPVAMDAGSQN